MNELKNQDHQLIRDRVLLTHPQNTKFLHPLPLKIYKDLKQLGKVCSVTLMQLGVAGIVTSWIVPIQPGVICPIIHHIVIMSRSKQLGIVGSVTFKIR